MDGKEHKIDKNQMGERIRLLREGRGLSRNEFAKAVHTSSRHLADIETGSRGMSLNLLYRVAKELDTTTDYILDGGKAGDEDSQRVRIKENIVSYLGACTTPALARMEEITRSYVFSHVDREDTDKEK